MGDRCPLCGGTSGVTEDDDGYSCLLCGGPRVLVDPPMARRGGEKPFLERAKRLRTRRATWGVAAGVATAAGLVALVVSGVLALVVHLGGNGGEIAAALVLGPLLFAAFGFARVKQTSAAVRGALDEAELTVVGEIAQARGGSVDTAELSSMLHVPIRRAEELSARAQVEGFLSSTEPLPAVRVRVDPGELPDRTADPSDPLETERRDRAR
jgi:hypothetical protein